LKTNNPFYKYLFILLALIFLGVFFVDWYRDNIFKAYLVFCAISCLLFSYRFTKKYNAKNSLVNLMKREAGIIQISRLKTIPFSNKSIQVSLEVSRISTLTVSNNLLSIIIDGNGNGYDFQLIECKQAIADYLQTLFSENEMSNIELKCI